MAKGSKKQTTPELDEDVSAPERGEKALVLWMRGKTYQQIADEVGYTNKGTAHNAVQRELARQKLPDVEAERKRAVMLLDTLLNSLYPLAFERLEMIKDADGNPKQDKDGNDRYERKKPDLFAVDRILAIEERRAKLLGIDTLVIPPTPTAQVLIQQVNFNPDVI